MELNGIKTVFTEAGYQPYVGSTKSLSGHALGAAGVHEAIYSLLMLREGFRAESANINEVAAGGAPRTARRAPGASRGRTTNPASGSHRAHAC